MSDVYAALMAPGGLPTLDDLADRPPWMRDALCREYPEVNFFPGRGEDTLPARAVCGRCLVRDECLAYALTLDDGGGLTGIWAGTSGRERRRLRP